jgi:E3 SUMO-protein ligase RanBP2
MRREQVLKICLNHALTKDIIYTPKDDKTWFFTANDFSEGELSLLQFCLRFKTKEIALEFKEAADKARDGKNADVTKTSVIGSNNESQNDDVVFVNEIQATAEERQKAKDLMLPENFFTYKVKTPCQGCRGCDLEDKPVSKDTLHASVSESLSIVSTPVKTSIPSFQSPTNSVYGTPANFDKTVEASMFRTPLGSLGSNTKSATPLSGNSTATIINDSTDKENTFTKKSNVFSVFSEQKNLFGTPENKQANVFSVPDVQNASTTKTTGILAPPKLNTFGTSESEKQNADPKSIFGAAQNNSIFGKNNIGFGGFSAGASMNKSIFGFPATENKTEDSEKPEVKSIFGNDSQKPFNLFSGNAQGSLFGPGSLSNNQSKPVGAIFGSNVNNSFGANTNPPQVFGNGNPVWVINSSTEQKKPDLTQDSNGKTPDVTKTDSDNKKEAPFKVENQLSFAALSTSGSDFSNQSK